jgi:DNA-binding NarL/FixJ family response regulator
MRLGAKGFLPKSTPFASLVAALRGVSRGELALSRAMTRRLAEEYRRVGHEVDTNPNELAVLTNREHEVLCLIGAGASNRDIANRLVISEHTVKVHVHNVLDKLHLDNRAQAGFFARRYGLDRYARNHSPE